MKRLMCLAAFGIATAVGIATAASSTEHGFRGVLGATARRWRRLTTSLFDSYRPELHYMRGPGPKWRAKHAGSAGFAS